MTFCCVIRKLVPCQFRPALPDLFRQRGALTLLQPQPDSALSFPELGTLSEQQPILLQNLHAFLAEKLQLADRCIWQPGLSSCQADACDL